MSTVNITIVIDGSGSMGPLTTETISGYNRYISEQKNQPGSETTVTLVIFDDRYQVIYKNKPLADVPELTHEVYRPLGYTALYDAIGKSIDLTRPGKNMLVVMTDGEENASKEFNFTSVSQRIKDAQDYHGWEVIFLGANIRDIQGFTKSLNISGNNTYAFAANASGIAESYSNIAMRSTSLRSSI